MYSDAARKKPAAQQLTYRDILAVKERPSYVYLTLQSWNSLQHLLHSKHTDFYLCTFKPCPDDSLFVALPGTLAAQSWCWRKHGRIESYIVVVVVVDQVVSNTNSIATSIYSILKVKATNFTSVSPFLKKTYISRRVMAEGLYTALSLHCPPFTHCLKH